MTDDQPRLDPEREHAEGEHQQDDAEDLALEGTDAEQVEGGGWPPVYSNAGASRGGPI